MNDDKKFWNKVARFYAKFMSNNMEAYEELNSVLSKYLSHDDHVLEIGCGSGQLSFLLANSVDSLIATDFSEKMIAICNDVNTQDNIEFRVEDARNLSFDDNTFDVVVASNVLHITPNMDVVLSEIKRVLRNEAIIFAPIFVYDNQKNNLRRWFLDKLGFKTYAKLTSSEYIDYLKNKGFIIEYSDVIIGSPLDECVVVAKVISES